MRISELVGGVYTQVMLPATASDANSAVVAQMANPFPGHKGYIESSEIFPAATVTGDNTNSTNYNLQLVDGTQIATKTYPTSTNGAKGVADAMTISGTKAQRTIAADGAIFLQQEEVGTQPARVAGFVWRVKWRGYGA